MLLQVSGDIDPNTKVVVYGLSMDRQSAIVAAAESGVAGLHLQSGVLRGSAGYGAYGRKGAGAVLAGGLRGPDEARLRLRRATEPRFQHRITDGAESEILELLDQGLSNQQIATRLSVTLHTVKNHVHSVLSKLGVGSRARRGHRIPGREYAKPRIPPGLRARRSGPGGQKGLLTSVQRSTRCGGRTMSAALPERSPGRGRSRPSHAADAPDPTRPRSALRYR